MTDPRGNSGNAHNATKELAVHVNTSGTRWVKSSRVTPYARVNSAPPYPDTRPAKFNTDTNVAYKLASTPEGHSFAANTKHGMRAMDPNTDRNKSSPAAKNALGMPHCWFQWLTRTTGVAPKRADTTTTTAKKRRYGVNPNTVGTSPSPTTWLHGE